MNPRYTALLHREWMQHHRAWLLLAAVPPLLMLGLLALGRVDITVDSKEALLDLAQLQPAAIAMVTVTAASVLCMAMAWATALIQAPGLARRDLSDRSVEFWLAVPVGHASALSAPLLVHLLLYPLGALALGTLAGMALTPLTLARFSVDVDWLGLPWGTVVVAQAALVLRFALGLLLASLWISPLVLTLMAASAWLRRWGLPAVLATVTLLGSLLDKVYGNPLVWELLGSLLWRAGRSFVSGRAGSGLALMPGQDPMPVLQALPGWALVDAGHSMRLLADPMLPAALAVSAMGFALLVMRRRQGG